MRHSLPTAIGVLATASWLAAAAVSDAGMVIRPVAGRGIGDGRPATAAALDAPSDVAIAPDGGVLIVDRGHHRIRRIDPASGIIRSYAGTVQGILGDGGVADQVQLKQPLRLTVTASGTVLVAELGSHRVRAVDPSNAVVSTVAGRTDMPGGTGDGGPPGEAFLFAPTDVAEAGGVVWIADYGNNRVRRIQGGRIQTIAGTGAAGFDGDGGPATAAILNGPSCVLPAPGDVLYVCDRNNHVIRRIAGGTITTVAGVPGDFGFDGDGALAGKRLQAPEALALDATGRLVVADTGNNRVRRIDLAAQTIETLAGTGFATFAPDNPSAATSALAEPLGVAVGPDGRILVAEGGSNRVRAIGVDGTLVTVAGDGAGSFGGDGGPAADATFGQVKSACLDPAGNLLVPDALNGRIRRVLREGGVETVAGAGLPGDVGDGGPAIAAGLANPSDALVDPQGRLIITDTDHDRVRMVGADTLIVPFAGTGEPGFSGDGGPAASAQLNHPTGLALAADGSVVIADFDNHRIRHVGADGIITTLAGDGTGGFNGDGLPAEQTSLDSPTDALVGPDGALYIADFRNHRIRRVDPATRLVSTIAGTGAAGSSGDGGPAIGARLRLPSDVVLDVAGNLLIADSGNHRVRRLRPNGIIETVAGTGAFGLSGDGGPAAQARLGAPLRMLALADGRVLVADRDTAVLRALVPDTDDDGIGDDEDRCPADPDPVQADGDGDGIGDACDVCPAVADPAQADTDADGVGDACERPGGGGGGSGCRSCLPGGGGKRTDCLLEVDVAGASLRGRRADCTDGDPACDGDAVPGQCTLSVRLCFNVTDPRLASCSAGALTAVRVARPRTDARDAREAAAATSLMDALDGHAAAAVTGGRPAGVRVEPALTAREDCTSAATLVVAAGAKLRLAATALTATRGPRGRDRDVITVRCKT